MCSLVRLVGSLVDCCTLRAVGRRSGAARGSFSCGGPGFSRLGLRTGQLAFAALLQLHSQAVDVAGQKSKTPGLSPLLGAPLPSLCDRVAVGRAAPHCAVVFNSCLTTRLGADVRKLPVQGHEGLSFC